MKNKNKSKVKSHLESTMEVSDKMLNGSDLTRKDLSYWWKKLFIGSRSGMCKNSQIKAKAFYKIAKKKNKVKGRKADKIKLPWIKSWGFQDSAYLFDFLDPVFKKPILNLFEESYQALKSIKNKDTRKYKDLFDIKKLISDKQIKSKKKIDFKTINKNFNPNIYSNSINTVQLNKAMKDWDWFIKPGVKDYAYELVSKYDIDGDGRLNPREMILANIWHNKNIIGKGNCIYCFAEIARQLDAIFIFLDCQNKGAISVEDLWNKLPMLVRPDNRWNIFGIQNNDNIRTSAVNDFCLKNGVANQGFITKKEFRTGILLGYWDRQTNRKNIILDDSRNLKKLRWNKSGTIDTVAFRYYQKRLKKKAKKLF